MKSGWNPFNDSYLGENYLVLATEGLIYLTKLLLTREVTAAEDHSVPSGTKAVD